MIAAGIWLNLLQNFHLCVFFSFSFSPVPMLAPVLALRLELLLAPPRRPGDVAVECASSDPHSDSSECGGVGRPVPFDGIAGTSLFLDDDDGESWRESALENEPSCWCCEGWENGRAPDPCGPHSDAGADRSGADVLRVPPFLSTARGKVCMCCGCRCAASGLRLVPCLCAKWPVSPA